MKYDAKEYWIINAMKKAITEYTLNSEGLYEKADIKVGTRIIESVVLEGVKVGLETLFL